jgi:uncharacterized protein affecting Mg2+/Co2+ transport
MRNAMAVAYLTMFQRSSPRLAAGSLNAGLYRQLLKRCVAIDRSYDLAKERLQFRDTDRLAYGLRWAFGRLLLPETVRQALGADLSTLAASVQAYRRQRQDRTVTAGGNAGTTAYLFAAIKIFRDIEPWNATLRSWQDTKVELQMPLSVASQTSATGVPAMKTITPEMGASDVPVALIRTSVVEFQPDRAALAGALEMPLTAAMHFPTDSLPRANVVEFEFDSPINADVVMLETMAADKAKSGFRHEHTNRTSDGLLEVSIRTFRTPALNGVGAQEDIIEYEVTFTNTGGSDSVAVLARHWYFTNITRNCYVHEVVGYAVVGETPRIDPGAKHTYKSRTTLPKGHHGYIRGSFLYVVGGHELLLDETKRLLVRVADVGPVLMK